MQRLVYTLKKLIRFVGKQVSESNKILLNLVRWQASHKTQTRCNLFLTHDLSYVRPTHQGREIVRSSQLQDLVQSLLTGWVPFSSPLLFQLRTYPQGQTFSPLSSLLSLSSLLPMILSHRLCNNEDFHHPT